MHRMALLAALLLAGCGRSAPATDGIPDEVVVARARAALAPFKTTLRDTLMNALGEGPEAAIDACAKRAPELAEEASHDGIVVGRSGLLLRNPANAPRPWLAPVLDELSRAPRGSDAHEVVSLPDGRRGYAEAIWVGSPCLLCHGETVAPAIDQRLRARYPEDRARGFHAGDFRGVFWAELDPRALAAK